MNMRSSFWSNNVLLVLCHSVSWLLCWDSFSNPCGLCLSEISGCQCQWFVRSVLQTFAHWPWQVPVSLHDEPTTCLHSEGRLMPIVMPCTPPEFCVSNVTKGSFKKIREELTRGYALTRVSLKST